MSKIKLLTISLTNFRNIERATYNVAADRVAISGFNGKGKTNVLEAISYLLSDKQLDGGYSPMANKPKGKTHVEVIVSGIFEIDGRKTKVEKVYRECYKKDQPDVLDKHETYFLIGAVDNPIKYKATEGVREMNRLFGINEIMPSVNIPAKVEIYPMIFNPLYLPDVADPKFVRELLINIVGDVKDEDVFEKVGMFNDFAKKVLDDYYGDSFKARKSCVQKAKDLENDSLALDKMTIQLNEVTDIDDESYNNAASTIEEYNKAIYDLNNQKEIENPKLTSLKKELADSNETLNKLVRDSIDSVTNYNKETKSQIATVDSKIKDMQGKMKDAQKEVYSVRSEVKTSEFKISTINSQIEHYESKMNDYRIQYRDVNKEVFTETEEAITCPNCGTVINQLSLDKHKSDWEMEKSKKLCKIAEDAHKTKLEIDSLNFDLADEKAALEKLNEKLVEDEQKLTIVEKDIDSLEKEREELKSYLHDYVKTKEVCDMENAINDIKIAILNEQNNNDYTLSINTRIEQYKALIEEQKEITKVRDNYLFSRDQLAIKEKKRISTNHYIMQYRQCIAAIDLFLKTKLDMLTEKVNRVFPDVTWTLVELNMKEGSWNDVCYPMVKGKEKVPFSKGSTSEKIKTGIAIVEDLRKAINLPMLPIVFDLAETLDAISVKNLGTECQIISAMVDNIHEVPKACDLISHREII